MANQHVSEGRYRIVTLRLTEEEHAAWIAAAKTAGLSWSHYVRLAVGNWILLHPPKPKIRRREGAKTEEKR